MYFFISSIFFYFSFYKLNFCCNNNNCCYCKKNNNEINVFDNKNNKKKQDKIKENNKDNDKENKDEINIYTNDNGVSPFQWYNVNCTLKSTITEFNTLCNYIPEIIERIKDENNIIKDSINIEIKKYIINEILNQRQQYLELKKGIDVDKFLDLIIEYIEITIKTIPIKDLYQQKYKDLIKFFETMFGYNIQYNNLKNYIIPIYIFSEIDNEQDDDTKKQELENFKKIRNNIDLKNHNNKTGIDLYQFFYFINKYIVQFIDKKEMERINNGLYYQCYTIKNNKIKIYKGFKKNINYKYIINNNINNVISINLTGRYRSTLSHSISIQKYKNNYYFDSYNHYIKVSKENIINHNFHKMFEDHGKLTLKNTFEHIDYIVTIETQT